MSERALHGAAVLVLPGRPVARRGAARLRIGDLDGAEEAFRESLKAAPNNGWSLYGLSEVRRARGDTAAAEATAGKWREAWIGEESLLSLERL